MFNVYSSSAVFYERKKVDNIILQTQQSVEIQFER